MDIRPSEVIWLVGATAMVVAAFLTQRIDNGLRWPWIEDAAQMFVAVGYAILGSEAAVAGRVMSATVSLVAAAMIGVATLIRARRRVRKEAATGQERIDHPR